MNAPGRMAAEEAVRMVTTRTVAPHKVWTRWAEKWLAGEVTPEKVLWAKDEGDQNPGVEALKTGDWAAWHAWCAARCEFLPEHARYLLDRVRERVAASS